MHLPCYQCLDQGKVHGLLTACQRAWIYQINARNCPLPNSNKFSRCEVTSHAGCCRHYLEVEIIGQEQRVAGVVDGIPFQHAVVCLTHNALQSKDQCKFTKTQRLARPTQLPTPCCNVPQHKLRVLLTPMIAQPPRKGALSLRATLEESHLNTTALAMPFINNWMPTHDLPPIRRHLPAV